MDFKNIPKGLFNLKKEVKPIEPKPEITAESHQFVPENAFNEFTWPELICKDALDLLKDLKNDGLSEDLCKDSEDEIQKITNSYIKKIDDLVEVKEKDIMTI